MDKNEEKLTMTLGLKNLRVDPSMYDAVTSTAKADMRSIQDQVRWLISLGLEARNQRNISLNIKEVLKQEKKL